LLNLESLVKSRLCDVLRKNIERLEERVRTMPDSDLRKAYYLETISGLKEKYKEMCGGGE
jgi:macrodomain Ter protein organizer (MatP/YcbG family)